MSIKKIHLNLERDSKRTLKLVLYPAFYDKIRIRRLTLKTTHIPGFSIQKFVNNWTSKVKKVKQGSEFVTV